MVNRFVSDDSVCADAKRWPLETCGGTGSEHVPNVRQSNRYGLNATIVSRSGWMVAIYSTHRDVHRHRSQRRMTRQDSYPEGRILESFAALPLSSACWQDAGLGRRSVHSPLARCLSFKPCPRHEESPWHSSMCRGVSRVARLVVSSE